MRARIARWGNSLAVRVPRAVARQAGLAEGTAVELTARAGALAVVAVPEVPSLAELLARITADNRHDAIDSGPALGAEVW